MTKYKEFKEEQQEQYNEFSDKWMFYAFNDEQFEEGLKKFGLTMENYYEHLYSTAPNGAFILKEKAEERWELLEKLHEEMMEMLNHDDEFLKDAFLYELGNHEYVYTGDDITAIGSVGYTIEEFKASSRLQKVYREAVKEYLNTVEA